MLIKNREETYKHIFEMGRNNDYTTGNLVDYECFSKHYKLIAVDLSKQVELENSDSKQEIKFVGRLERKEEATMFFIIKKSEERSQQTFAGLQDVFKTSSRHVLKTPSTSLQRNNFTSSKTS